MRFGGLLALVWVAAPLCAQTVTRWDKKQNTYFVEYEGGATAELEFVSASTFRMRRGLAGPPRRPIVEAVTECKASMTTAGLRLETADLVITLSKEGGLLGVALPAGLKLYTEAAARVEDGNSLLEVEVPASEKFYGLGPRPQAEANARGLLLKPVTPFFVAGSGYAFWIATPSPFEFDMGKTRADRVKISGNGMEWLEYYFTYGPSMKEIWEERQKIVGALEPPSPQELELLPGPRLPRGVVKLPPSDLCGDAHGLVHASLSGVLIPAFDLARHRTANDAEFRRAARLGVFAGVFQDSAVMPYEGAKAAMAEQARVFRKRLSHFLITYADEARARGYPMLHPLLHQFPRDQEAGRHIDSFMFGDEMLIVPVCDGAARKEVYLPMGIWTDWRTEKEYRGRQMAILEVPEDGVVVLAKNGSLIPLSGVGVKDPTELHYFPKLGGEFFLYEPEAAEYTQAHAVPAMDFYRVQMESKVARDYEWVLHHLDKPKKVEQVEGPVYEETSQAGPVTPGKWRYDARDRTVHVGMRAAAHSDIIVNIRP